jgi:hypothetical protein
VPSKFFDNVEEGIDFVPFKIMRLVRMNRKKKDNKHYELIVNPHEMV